MVHKDVSASQDHDNEDDGEVLLCPDCFVESGLKSRIVEIRPDVGRGKCKYHPTHKGVPISEIAKIVEPVMRANYYLGEYNVHYEEYKGTSLEEAVYDLVEPNEDEIAGLLANQLIDDDNFWPPDGGEAFFAEDLGYLREEPKTYHTSTLWRAFCKSVVHNQRFFNSTAKALVAELFDGVHFQRDADKQSPVYLLSPGEADAFFYRARIADDDADSKTIIGDPIEQLGPPPERKRRAGRMNPAGISVFYGAFEMDTCVAELRPQVGSRIVGAQFRLCRPIHVLDTTRFQKPMKPMSLFAKDYMVRIEQWHFMKSFMQEIARPISSRDEYLDYIPTQAVAEYLLHHHDFKRDGTPATIEAVIFQSAQHPAGRNIVLMGEAATVTLPITIGTDKRRQTFPDFFSDPISKILKDQRASAGPGLEFVDNSIKSFSVRGAAYEAIESTTDHHGDDDF